MTKSGAAADAGRSYVYIYIYICCHISYIYIYIYTHKHDNTSTHNIITIFNDNGDNNSNTTSHSNNYTNNNSNSELPCRQISLPMLPTERLKLPESFWGLIPLGPPIFGGHFSPQDKELGQGLGQTSAELDVSRGRTLRIKLASPCCALCMLFEASAPRRTPPPCAGIPRHEDKLMRSYLILGMRIVLDS